MDSNLDGTFAETLRRYREARTLSRNQLAGLVGLDGSYVHRLEMGNRRPSRTTVIAMADALELDADDTNKWLAAAGHGPLPISRETAAGIAVQVVRHGRGSADRQSSSAARRGVRFETLGLEQPILDRLSRAMDGAVPRERKRVAAIVSKTLHLLTQSLEISVHTAVIPAAGGSHLLVGKHVMQRMLLRAIGEAAACGIHEVILVLAPQTEEHFHTPLKEALEVAGVQTVNLRFCIQPQANGLGDAILSAEQLVGVRPFAVLLPDDVLGTRPGRASHGEELRLMINAFGNLLNTHLMAVTGVSKRNMAKYGIVEVGVGEAIHGTLPIARLIEKPEATHPIIHSDHALSIVGRYLLQPSIFGVLRKLSKQPRLELTTALEMLRTSGEQIRSFPLHGTRRDFGAVLGQANSLIEHSSSQT
jgi:UTP--glucose-1-phosphate uridylyltransferase